MHKPRTVKKLLSGQSIFKDNQIPKGSVEFWRNIYKEPSGSKRGPEDHLADLEYTPNEKYTGMCKPIDKFDVMEHPRVHSKREVHRNE